jgi:hypothetical protein
MVQSQPQAPHRQRPKLQRAPLEQSDNSRTVTPKPVIPIVIERKSSPNADVSDLPPQTEVSSPLATVVDTVNTTSTPQLLDLGEIENAKRVQHRLIDLGFLFARMMEFGVNARVERCKSSGLLMGLVRATPGMKLPKNGCSERQARRRPIHLRSVSLVDGVLTLLNVATPITITARRAEGSGASCEFHSTQRESSNAWRFRAECSSNTERWNANIRLTVSTSKLTWSSERGTTTYVRCPVTSASR